MKKKIFVRCMHGIGDTIYARPFVKMLAEDENNDVYLHTPLPFIFEDLDVKFLEIKPDGTLRTQGKMLKQSNVEFVEYPETWDREIDFFYTYQDIRSHGIVCHLEQCFGHEIGSTRPVFDLPILPHHGLDLPTNKKVAVVRPSTVRREWANTSRAPKENYIPWCAKILMDMGWHVISVADCEDREEWIIHGGEPLAHEKYHRGELSMDKMLSLFKSADLIIGGPSFVLPAGVAAQTNLFIIFGGRGRFDNPHKLFDLRMDLTKIGWALPDNFCRCQLNDHDCDKRISNLDDQFFKFIRDIQLREGHYNV